MSFELNFFSFLRGKLLSYGRSLSHLPEDIPISPYLRDTPLSISHPPRSPPDTDTVRI